MYNFRSISTHQTIDIEHLGLRITRNPPSLWKIGFTRSNEQYLIFKEKRSRVLTKQCPNKAFFPFQPALKNGLFSMHNSSRVASRWLITVLPVDPPYLTTPDRGSREVSAIYAEPYRPQKFLQKHILAQLSTLIPRAHGTSKIKKLAKTCSSKSANWIELWNTFSSKIDHAKSQDPSIVPLGRPQCLLGKVGRTNWRDEM